MFTQSVYKEIFLLKKFQIFVLIQMIFAALEQGPFELPHHDIGNNTVQTFM